MDRTDGCYIATVGTLYSMSGKEIADHLRESQENPSESEYRSWENSIPILVKVLHQAGLDALTSVLEYQTPIGDRIDAVLLGEGKTTGKPLVLVIELKQWSAIEENVAGRESSVSICLSPAENRFEERLHPVQQTLTYAKHLRMNHSNVADGKMDVRCRQFLHNFKDKEQLFQGSYQAYEPLRHETYTKGEEELLAADLRNLFSSEPKPEVVEQFLSGTYVLGQVGFRDLRNVLARKENAVMLDDQIEVNRKICSMIDQLRSPQFGKHLMIISGPPGTGKTVVGLHAIYAYCLKYGPSWQKKGGCIFALPRSRTLSQVIAGASGIAPVYLDKVQSEPNLVVVDEAHRIQQLESTMTSLFQKANMVVVLQDDRQRIRITEEGTVDGFRRFAQAHGISCSVYSLVSQKRAGYLGSYVSDLDKIVRIGNAIRISKRSFDEWLESLDL
ncbi:DNA/RNA helicase domain-containing protein [Angelakisella massiliensis]|uniref:DNA/RNA helicase domain-containing protein n=1 Tax=Angelakisella massiliensis TaxID=1871018 RepID=UPI0008F8368C|nr:DNA/RNA helicase domain-containing protein [Angelakisella massiliensis]